MKKKINYNTFKLSFGFKCTSCGGLTYEKRSFCDICGKDGTLRISNKKDYKEWLKK